MHDLSPLLCTILTGVGMFAAFVAIIFAWAGFLLDGAGRLDAAHAFFLMAVAVGVSSGFLLRTIWVNKE